jgi:hypothetical protein
MDSASTLIGIGAALGRDVERLRARVAAEGIVIEKSSPVQFQIATSDPKQKIVVSIAIGTPRDNLCEIAWITETGQQIPGTARLIPSFNDLLKALGK